MTSQLDATVVGIASLATIIVWLVLIVWMIREARR